MLLRIPTLYAYHRLRRHDSSSCGKHKSLGLLTSCCSHVLFPRNILIEQIIRKPASLARIRDRESSGAAPWFPAVVDPVLVGLMGLSCGICFEPFDEPVSIPCGLFPSSPWLGSAMSMLTRKLLAF